MSYRPMQLPPDTTQTVYVCDRCSAIVTDATLHTESHVRESAEPRKQSRVPNVQLDGAKL